MPEMTTKELTAYLKCAAELEASIYRQEEAIRTARNNLVLKKPDLKKIPAPTNKANSLTKPTLPPVVKSKLWVYLLVWGIFQGSLGAVCWAVGAGTGIGLLNLFFGISVGALGIASKCTLARSNSKRQKDYIIAQQNYNKSVEEANKAYQAALITYNKETKAAQEAYDKQYAVAERKYGYATTAVKQMNQPLSETKNALRKLYDVGIIFPKYRDMVAMCTIYEYFASGRCTELTGPTGAYNLYESELRMNLIVNKLDVIIRSLEDIKKNQYTLYNEMRATKDLLTGISADVRSILNTTNEIAASSKIAAHCAYVTAQNTEALKYISLING